MRQGAVECFNSPQVGIVAGLVPLTEPATAHAQLIVELDGFLYLLFAEFFQRVLYHRLPYRTIPQQFATTALVRFVFVVIPEKPGFASAETPRHLAENPAGQRGSTPRRAGHEHDLDDILAYHFRGELTTNSANWEATTSCDCRLPARTGSWVLSRRVDEFQGLARVSDFPANKAERLVSQRHFQAAAGGFLTENQDGRGEKHQIYSVLWYLPLLCADSNASRVVHRPFVKMPKSVCFILC